MLAPDGFFQQSVLGIVGVPLDAVFIHLRAVSDRPRFDLPDEQRDALAAIQRRTDLSAAEQEEFIQALRVRWYSQIGRTALELPGKVGVEKILQHATAQQPGIVILGSPGSGKSTTLRWLVFQMAHAVGLPPYRHWQHFVSRLLSDLCRRSFRWGDDLPEDLAPRQIPILFKVGDYAKANTTNAGLSSVQAYLSSSLKSEYEHLPRLAERLLQELDNGRCLVLIDGLDEVANDAMRRQVAERITAFCNHYSSDAGRYNRFIIASRIVGYEANKFTGYTHYTLQDLDDEQIEDFLSHWCPVVERYRMQAARNQRKLTSDQQAQADKEGRVHYQRLRDALRQNPGIKNLAINPLMLTLLALLQQSGRTLPHRRIELYQIVTRTLLDNWNQQTGRRIVAPDEVPLAEEMLSRLAYEMHSSDLLLTEAKVREIACRIMTVFYKGTPTDETIKQFIDTIRESSGLFVEGGQGLFCFMHRTFQEYYVAQHLILKPSDELRAFVEQHCLQSIWREPFLLLIAEKSMQRSQEASDLIQTILDTKKSYDRVLQRNLLLAAGCVIDCNVWKIEHSLQRKIAWQLFNLYSDTLGSGRYRPLHHEIRRLARLWLRGQPTESSSALPPLLAVWRGSLCDDTSAVRQEEAIRLLCDLAVDLPDCPRLVLTSLLPPLVILAGLLELPDFPLPVEIRRQCAMLSTRPSSIQITEYALVTLRLLDSDGPAGWLHRAWLGWNKERPELLEHLSQHGLELDYLLTPAAFPATEEDANWKKQLALGKNWQRYTRSNPRDLQARLLQASTAARFPYSYLYWQILRQEPTDSMPGQSWKASWQALLQQEMDRNHSATYQACLNLRLLLCQQDSHQQQVIANEIIVALSSQGQQQTMAIVALTNLYIQDIRVTQHIRFVTYILYILDILGIRESLHILGIRDIRDFRNIREIQFPFVFSAVQHVRVILDLFYIAGIIGLKDILDILYIRDILHIRDILDHKAIAIALCNIPIQGNTSSHTITLLFALYSFIVANKQIVTELQQPVEQALQQFESIASQRKMPVREEEQLINAIRQQLDPAAPTRPTSRFFGARTAEDRARHLDALKQRLQLSKEDMEELLDACADTRRLTLEAWQNLTLERKGWYNNNSVGNFAWQQLSHPFRLSAEAWTVLLHALESPEALLCGAATQVFQASKDVPVLVREQAVQIVLHILDDETLSYRSLETPDFRLFQLDNELFKTLQMLVEQEEGSV